MELAMLRKVTQAAGVTSSRLEFIVLHYTDCGITRLEDEPEMLSAYFEVEQNLLAAQAVSDPRAAVALDVARCTPRRAWRACAFPGWSTTWLPDSSTPS
jgi:carbonic anhydrase